MSKLDKEQVLAEFTAAYKKAHGKAPKIEDNNGWYSINGDKNVRLAQVAELTDELSNGAPAAAETKTTKATSKTKAKTKKTSSKTGASTKKSASKKASTKAKGTGGLTAKELWKQHLEKNHDARLPRGMQ